MVPDDDHTEELARTEEPAPVRTRSRSPQQTASPSARTEAEPPPRGRSGRGPLGPAAPFVAVAVAVALAIGAVPALRTVLRQSFTRISAPAAAMYFTGNPTVNGAVLDVPLAVDAHSEASTTFTVKAWLDNASGKPGTSTTVRIVSHGSVVTTTLQVPIPLDAEVVWVNLVGQSQSLHYRIAGNPIPTSTAH